jgi:predicted transcriptional regulator
MDDKKKTKYLSARINAQLFEQLDKFAKAKQRSRSYIVDRAIEEYLARHDKERRKSLST